MPDLEVLDSVRLHFSEGSLTLMNVILAFVMFRVALQIRIEDFRQIFQQPKSFIVGLLAQLVLLPAVTFLLCLALSSFISQSVALGMILVAACPGGNISNFITTLAKGNVSLSVSLSALSTLTCVIFTPLNFYLWGSLYTASTAFEVPFITISFWEMAKTVVILLGIPIVVGMLCAKFLPRITSKIMKPLTYFSVVAFVGFVVAALAGNFSYFLEYIHLIFFLVLLHNAIALCAGNFAAKASKCQPLDTRTITIETGIQNSGLGLILIFNPNLFNGIGGMAFVAAWWGIWHIISGLAIAYFYNRTDKKNSIQSITNESL